MTESSHNQRVSERTEELDKIKPIFSSLISAVKDQVTPKVVDIKPRHKLIKMDVGAGPEEGYYPEYEHQIGKYSLPMDDKSKVEEVLRQVGLIDPKFRVKSAVLNMELDPRVGNDFENNAVGEMIVVVKGRGGKGKYLGIVASFFLKDGSLSPNLNTYAFWKKRLPWQSNDLETFGTSASAEFYSRIGEIAKLDVSE